MAKLANTNSHEPLPAFRPALDPEARENQMIALAEALAEKQLREGTASSQLITEYIKRGSIKERLAQEKEIEEIKLLRAKTEALESAKKSEELFERAIRAMRDYQGRPDEDDDYDQDVY